jgi:hypothetical protein
MQQDTRSSRAASEADVTSQSASLTGSFALSSPANWSTVMATFKNTPPGGIAAVQSTSVEGTAVPSVSASFPAGNTAGNFIVAFVRMSTTGQTVSIADQAGNMYREAVAQTQNADVHQIHLFYASNIRAGPNTITASFSGTNNHPWLAIYEYSGLGSTASLDQAVAAQGASSTASAGSVPVNANELVFVATGLPASYTGTAAATAPFTVMQQDTRSSRATSEADVTGQSASLTGSFALSSPANWSTVMATFSAGTP